MRTLLFILATLSLFSLLLWSHHNRAFPDAILSWVAKVLFHGKHGKPHMELVNAPQHNPPKSSKHRSHLRITAAPNASGHGERQLTCGDMSCRYLGPFEMTDDQKTRLREQNYIGYKADWFRVEMIGTHNSYNNKENGYSCWPNQKASLTKQMESGLRLLNFDVVKYDGENILCHSYKNQGCSNSDRPLFRGLQDIKQFLEAPGNEKEFILLVIEHNYDNNSDKAASIAHEIKRELSDTKLFMPKNPLSWDSCTFPMNEGFEYSRKDLVDRGYRVAAVINKDDSTGDCSMSSDFRNTVFKIAISNPDKGGNRAKDDYESPRNTKLYKNAKHYVIYEDRQWGCGDKDKVNTGEVRKMQKNHGFNQMGLDDALLNDKRMERLIWSWGKDEPKGSAAGDCAAIEGSSYDEGKEGKWYANSCDKTFKAACRKQFYAGDMTFSIWMLTSSKIDFESGKDHCGSLGFGWKFEPPINAYENFQVQRLRDSESYYSDPIWVNYKRDPSVSPEWQQA